MKKKFTELSLASTISGVDVLPLLDNNTLKKFTFTNFNNTITNSHTSLGYVSDNSTTGTFNSFDPGNNTIFLFIASGTMTINGIIGGSTGRVIRIIAGSDMTITFNREFSGINPFDQIRPGDSSVSINNRGISLEYIGNRWFAI